MNSSIVGRAGIHTALKSRMEKNPRLGDRTHYIGASEIGSCLRRVVLSKLQPEPFDEASMGRMLAGRAMENEVVQLVRIALGPGRLRNTGRVQLDLQHPTLPFRAHPDGRVIGGDFEDLEGDGVLEVKTASATTFKRYQSDGLPSNYLAQVQAQMGLSGLLWGMVVLVSRENLAEMATYVIHFDAAHYARLEERAAVATSCLRKDVQTLNNIQTDLPGETDCGFCHTCPYSAKCAIFQTQREAGKRGEISEVTRLQLECQLEELASLEANLEPIQERVAELRDQVKNALYTSGANKVVLENGTVQLVESSRTSFDSKALQRDDPTTFARFQKTSTYSNLRITHKGDSKCLSMAS
jgi:CRISPR-associated exonuclease Cas4